MLLFKLIADLYYSPNFRPSSCEVLSHCFFWSKARKLAFFQDVSDRVEKEPYASPIIQALEQGGMIVVRRDWRENITDDLKEGMFKSRHLIQTVLDLY